MKQDIKPGVQNSVKAEQQRDHLAADLAFLVVHAHRHDQRDVDPPADAGTNRSANDSCSVQSGQFSC